MDLTDIHPYITFLVNNSIEYPFWKRCITERKNARITSVVDG